MSIFSGLADFSDWSSSGLDDSLSGLEYFSSAIGSAEAGAMQTSSSDDLELVGVVAAVNGVIALCSSDFVVDTISSCNPIFSSAS